MHQGASLRHQYLVTLKHIDQRVLNLPPIDIDRINEMSEEDAEKAISQFNGTELDGRALTINEARPQVKRDGGGGGGRGGYNRY